MCASTLWLSSVLRHLPLDMYQGMPSVDDWLILGSRYWCPFRSRKSWPVFDKKNAIFSDDICYRLTHCHDIWCESLRSEMLIQPITMLQCILTARGYILQLVILPLLSSHSDPTYQQGNAQARQRLATYFADKNMTSLHVLLGQQISLKLSMFETCWDGDFKHVRIPPN